MTTPQPIIVPKPTLNQVLGGIIQNAIEHPKSTLQSLLTALLFGDLMLLGCGCLSTKATAIAGGVLSAAKVGMGMIQKDAGITPAMLPGDPNPQMVESREVPVSPVAVPVVQADASTVGGKG